MITLLSCVSFSEQECKIFALTVKSPSCEVSLWTGGTSGQSPSLQLILVYRCLGIQLSLEDVPTSLCLTLFGRSGFQFIMVEPKLWFIGSVWNFLIWNVVLGIPDPIIKDSWCFEELMFALETSEVFKVHVYVLGSNEGSEICKCVVTLQTVFFNVDQWSTKCELQIDIVLVVHRALERW